MGRPPRLYSAILLNPAGRPLMVLRLDIHSEMPSRNVLIPRVTTMVLTPATTTSRPLTAPTARAATTATIDAGSTPQWWLTTSTGRIVAENPFDTIDEALEIANALPYGLAAYGFTGSAATAERLIAGFEAGILSTNHCGGSVPQAPSGGVKDSGYGRECGHEGLAGYLVTKRVSHRLSP